jgi:hypothetical protein
MQNRCSFCGVRGHTRITCPTRIQAVAKARSLHSHTPEALSIRQKSLIVEDNQILQKKKNPTPRKCSYCRGRYGRFEYGHNRRNCPQLKEDKEKVIPKNKVWRELALESMAKHGFGVGTIFEYAAFNEKHRYIVTDVLWDRIGIYLPYSEWAAPKECFTVQRFDGVKHTLNFIRTPHYDHYTCFHIKKLNILVPMSERSIRSNASDDWLEGKEGLELLFSKKSDKLIDHASMLS